MKKLLIMSIALVAIMATVFTVSAFAANTVSIDAITGISITEYTDPTTGEVNDDYVTIGVTYTATADPDADPMSRITFMLSATTVVDELEGNEAKIVYIDEQVTPQSGTYSFVAEKARIQSALGAATIEDIESSTLYFKMGGVGVDEAATVNVVYNSPNSGNELEYGNVNGDAGIDHLDASLVMQAIVEKVTLTAEQTKLANVDGSNEADGVVVTHLDASLIMQYIVEKITSFPAASM